LVGLAVNVTGEPMQMLFAEATIVTEGVTGVVMFMVILLLVTVAGATQMALLVIVQVTMSPLASVLVLNVVLLAPSLMPLSCH